MIFFRNYGNEMEKYLVTVDTEKMKDLKTKIALQCGEQSTKKKTVKIVPESNTFYREDDTYHYYREVHSKLSKRKGVEWDHYYEYEVNLYDCVYIDYLCPPLVTFISEFFYDEQKSITIIFDRKLQELCSFPKVKDKIVMLQNEIASVSQSYKDKRNKIVEELNKKYKELNQNIGDIESHIKEINDWTSKTKKELLTMDKDYLSKIKELNEKLKYYLSIEKQNKNQEDVTKYIEELYSLVDIRLIDKISLDEIKRVKDFQSNKISKEKEIQLFKK
jgi:hypothetical protein